MANAEVTIQDFDETVPTTVAGTVNVDTKSMTGVGGKTVQRQVVCLGDETTFGNVANVTADGALQVDGSGVTQPVSIAATVATTIKDSTGDSAMDDVNNAVRVNVIAGASSGTEYTEDAASAANPAGTQLIARRRDALAGETTTDGDSVALNSTDKGELYVKHVDIVAVSASNLDIRDLSSASDSVTAAISSMPNEGQQTMANSISVAIASNQSGVPVDGSAVTQPVSAVSLPLPTGASTLAEQQTQTTSLAAIETAVEALDNAIAGNEVQVDVLTLPAIPAGTNNIGDVDVLTLPKDGQATMVNSIPVVIASNQTAIPVTDNAGSITVDGAVSLAAAVPAGTNNIGDVDVLTLPALVAGTANIGDVDVLTLPALPAGNNNIGDVDVATIAAGDNNIGNVDVVTLPNVTLAAGTNTNEVVGDAAHDAAAAGNPVLTAGIAQDMDDTDPPNRVSAEGDVARFSVSRSGVLYVHPHAPQIWSYHEDSSSALTDAEVHASAGTGLSLYVTDIIVSTNAATALNIFFEEGSTKKLGPYYLEAVAGRGLAIHFGVPKKMTAATALTVTTSAAIAHSIDITGYVAAG